MTYDPTTVTLRDLVAMERLLRGYTGDLAEQIHEDCRRHDSGARTSGSQLKLLTVVHGCPSTHSQARHNARRLADTIVGEGILAQTDTPRLHYANRNGGIRSDFSETHKGGAFHPARFGERISLGGAWTCVCATHNANYENCDGDCRVGVQLNGRFLIDIFRGAA